MSLRILILEDDPERWKHFRRCFIGHEVGVMATAVGAIAALKLESYDALFLDHDLGEPNQASGPGTGYEVAKWLERHPERCPRVVVLHSLNKPGRDAMKAAIPHALDEPFVWPKPELMAQILALAAAQQEVPA